LIAVTVAVSIAVAAWMGALSGMFMGGAEQVSIVDVRYYYNSTTQLGYVEIDVTNGGSGTITVNDIRIDDTTYRNFNVTSNGQLTGTITSLPYDIEKGDSVTFKINFGTIWPFRSGVTYTFKVVTAKGTQVSYPKTAPGT
jgi:hypothetical protein